MCLFYLRNSLKLTLTTSLLGFHCPTLVGNWRFSILVEQTLEFRRVVCPRYFFAPDCSYLNLLLPLEAQLTALTSKIILASLTKNFIYELCGFLLVFLPLMKISSCLLLKLCFLFFEFDTLAHCMGRPILNSLGGALSENTFLF